jgi:hypothetical protein
MSQALNQASQRSNYVSGAQTGIATLKLYIICSNMTIQRSNPAPRAQIHSNSAQKFPPQS